jgi:hypothetical protein
MEREPDILEVAGEWLQNPTEEESVSLVQKLYDELVRSRAILDAYAYLFPTSRGLDVSSLG